MWDVSKVDKYKQCCVFFLMLLWEVFRPFSRSQNFYWCSIKLYLGSQCGNTSPSSPSLITTLSFLMSLSRGEWKAKEWTRQYIRRYLENKPHLYFERKSENNFLSFWNNSPKISMQLWVGMWQAEDRAVGTINSESGISPSALAATRFMESHHPFPRTQVARMWAVSLRTGKQYAAEKPFEMRLQFSL